MVLRYHGDGLGDAPGPNGSYDGFPPSPPKTAWIGSRQPVPGLVAGLAFPVPEPTTITPRPPVPAVLPLLALPGAAEAFFASLCRQQPGSVGSGKAKCPAGDRERKLKKRAAQAERCRQHQQRLKGE